MTATVVLQRPPTTPWLRANWLARRRKGLTATDIPALFGLSPWRTPLDVWLSKLRPVLSSHTSNGVAQRLNPSTAATSLPPSPSRRCLSQFARLARFRTTVAVIRSPLW